MTVNIVPTPVIINHPNTSSGNNYSQFYKCKNSDYIIKIYKDTNIRELDKRCTEKEQVEARRLFCEIKENRNQCSFCEVHAEICAFIIIGIIALFIWLTVHIATN